MNDAIKYLKFVCLTCMVLVVLPAAQAQSDPIKNEKIVVEIITFDFPPNAHMGVNGEVSGLATETIRYICEYSQMNCRFTLHPAARAYQNIENGNKDVLMTAKYDRFNSCCTFAQWQYPFRAGFLSIEENITPPMSEEELTGQHIIMVRGWQSIYGTFPNLARLEKEGKVKISTASSNFSAVSMLVQGRAQLLWGSDTFNWHYQQITKQQKPMNFKVFDVTPAGIWVSKTSKYYDIILTNFRNSTLELQEKGLINDVGFLNNQLMSERYSEAMTGK